MLVRLIEPQVQGLNEYLFKSLRGIRDLAFKVVNLLHFK